MNRRQTFCAFIEGTNQCLGGFGTDGGSGLFISSGFGTDDQHLINVDLFTHLCEPAITDQLGAEC